MRKQDILIMEAATIQQIMEVIMPVVPMPTTGEAIIRIIELLILTSGINADEEYLVIKVMIIMFGDNTEQRDRKDWFVWKYTLL